MPKVDLKKENKDFYYPSAGDVSVVELPAMKFLMIDGQGDPNTSEEYQNAMETIFPVSYKTKFISKKEKSQDYVVMPLEGLWWADNMEEFSIVDKSSWKWTVMIRQPDFVDKSLVDKAISELVKKKDLPSLSELRFDTFEEGLAVQIMHIGPYGEAEGLAVGKLHKFIENEGYKLRGKHHEIYISDMRRIKPEKLKTVIRQPFK
ncbi:GyrI-like domain-containing protein [Methanobacterium sp.]|uniref:GyrI-like domain-containing protein n=1 Tax=Methanobacterium sp. TaxID=2164 RepID=UPI0025F958EA|nr:GyrI-like domain-containing protein [Methanobacterium sp.]MBI5459780.1 GyrI-like domain-containing protein [Methanobacterium sp.]